MGGRVARFGAVCGAAGLAVLLLAGVASAHVSIDPQVAAKGSIADVTITMPNERDNAESTSLVMELPAEYPLTTVEASPVDGWSVNITKVALDKPVVVNGQTVTEVASQISWTADSPEAWLKKDEKAQFGLKIGPLPDVDMLAFKALQTYSSGEVVRWIQLSDGSGKEPERPAPFLRLIGPSSSSPDASSTSGTKVAFVIGGVVVIVLAAGAAAVVGFRRRA